MERKCCNCGKKTENWQRINGSPWHCYDGCRSTTGRDHRQPNGISHLLLEEGSSEYDEAMANLTKGVYYP